MAEERRHNFRVATELSVVCYPLDAADTLGPSFPGTILDLSANGASLLVEQRTKAPRRICVQLRVDDPEIDLLVIGRIVSARHTDALRCGLRFEGLTTETRAELTRFVFAEAKRLKGGDRAVPTADERTPAARITTTGGAPTGRLTVAQFAEQIGQTEPSARRLLGTGLVPGARRLNPTNTRSHWIIPTTAPADYLALFRRQRVRGGTTEPLRPLPAPLPAPEGAAADVPQDEPVELPAADVTAAA